MNKLVLVCFGLFIGMYVFILVETISSLNGLNDILIKIMQ